MPTHSIEISDADAEASGVLQRMRLDGLDAATVPFDERCVRAWRRGQPEPNMDVDMLVNVLWVRLLAPYRPCARQACCGQCLAAHPTVPNCKKVTEPARTLRVPKAAMKHLS